nr:MULTISPECIES: MFS transporter [Myxococcaceae]
MPGTMAAFALLLVGHACTGSYAKGAWMASVYAGGLAVAAPWRGRRLDRAPLQQGVREGLHWLALGALGLAALAALRAPLPLLLAASLLLGVLPAGVPGGVRALLSATLPEAQRPGAFALDAVLTELQWVLGPLAVGAVAAAGSPLLALGLMAGCALAGSLLCPGFESEAPRAEPAPRAGAALWRLPGVPRVLALSLVLGASWGAVDAGLPPRLEEVGARAAAWGVLAALLAAASAVGGLAAAASTREPGAAAAARRALGLLALWGAALLPLVGAGSLASLALWLTLAGLFLAPLSGTLTFLLQSALPRTRQAEGFSLYSACWALGMALGNGAAGALLGRWGARPVLGLAALLPLGVALALALPRPAAAPAAPDSR